MERKPIAIKEEALLSFTSLYLGVFPQPAPFLNLGAMTSLFITIVLFTLVDNMYVKEFYFPPKRNVEKIEGVHFRGPTTQDTPSPNTETKPIFNTTELAKMDGGIE
jgi:hypothetical protein